MGWLSRLLNPTPQEELNGIQLDTANRHWELDGETRFAALLRALADLLPAGSILYFEDGLHDQALLAFFAEHAIPEQTHIAVGTLWPRPAYYHVPATPENLAELAALAETRAEPEIAIHFHAYREGEVLLEWFDAFDQSMLLNGGIPEERVRSFSEALGMTCKLNTGAVAQAGGHERS